MPRPCAVEVGDLIGADDDGLLVAGRDRVGLGQRQTKRSIGGRSPSQRRFVDARRDDRERQAQPLEQLAPIARGRGEDEAPGRHRAILHRPLSTGPRRCPKLARWPRTALPIHADSTSPPSPPPNGELNGEWAIAALRRLTSATLAIARRRRPRATSRGRRTASGCRCAARGPAAVLLLEADAEVILECQRCLQPMRWPLQARRRIFFVEGEDAAAALDAESEDDVLALVPALDLQALVEDELLLALPIVPRHDVCPEPLPRAFVEDDGASAPEEQPVRRAGGAQARARAELTSRRGPRCYNARLSATPRRRSEQAVRASRRPRRRGYQEISMAVQQNKKSPSKRGMHRAHNALAKPGLAIEPTTGETHLRHHVSPTGFYRGRKVLKTKVEA